ncbi:MAG: MFS family permease [Halovenus sp.]
MGGDETVADGTSESPSSSEAGIQFYALYLTRFAEGFGFTTLLTLLPAYIDTLQPQDCRLLGLTVSAGLIIGLYTTGFTLTQTVAVVPLARVGDRFDKRTVLLVVIGFGAGVYALFPLVDSSVSFIAVRAVQGVAVTGAGLMTLALVGQLATVNARAERIGRANAASFLRRFSAHCSSGGCSTCPCSPRSLA